MGLRLARLFTIVLCAHCCIVATCARVRASVITNDPPRYHVIDLGAIGGFAAYAAAINSSNQVAGTTLFDPASTSNRAFFHDGTAMHDLAALGAQSGALGINNLGQVVGYATVNFNDHAFLYDPATAAMHDLGTMGAQWAYAASINDSGAIVGTRSFDNTTYRAFLYASGVPQELALLGGDYSQALAINNAGQIVGHSSIAPGDAPLHAFLYHNGVANDLGTLGGANSVALAINNLGHVVGAAEYTTPEQYQRAALWRDGEIVDLGSLGGVQAWANGINDAGVIVGESMLPDDGPIHAWIYTDRMLDLNDFLDVQSQGWTIEEANGINNAGYIAASGNTSDGQTHALLLRPVSVPEPGAGAPIAGMIALMMRRVRRRLRLMPEVA
jgi:probable HAF family extracellular repeat protein